MTKCDGTLIVKYSKYMSIIQIIEMKVYIQVNILEVQNVASQLTDGQIVKKGFWSNIFPPFPSVH